MNVDTKQYKYYHGKVPTGYGLWFFEARVIISDKSPQIKTFFGHGKTAQTAWNAIEGPLDKVKVLEVYLTGHVKH